MIDGAAFRAQAKGIYDDCLSAYMMARERQPGAVSSFFSSSSWNVEAQFDEISKQLLIIEPNTGKYPREVLAGTRSVESYLKFAKDIQRQLSGMLAEFGSMGFQWGRFWNEVVAQSASDTKEVVVQAADLGLDYAPWVLGAVILGFASYLVLSFKR